MRQGTKSKIGFARSWIGIGPACRAQASLPKTVNAACLPFCLRGEAMYSQCGLRDIFGATATRKNMLSRC